ncbi:cytochrome P450 4c21-like [Anthonomus grandis grandis]|uniref:cytochrome P450 4c21-like n=1 Tax=Anthonomus grandis grandis TaxID=2921223 RepID=UPI0021662140|nr:cytochrome P450 4c21-like [Anthonomus grandis grandis]
MFVLNLFLLVLLFMVLYYVFLIARNYRVFKFSLTVYGNRLPLLPFAGNTYVALFTGRKVNMLATLLWAEKYVGMPVNFWFGHKYHYMCDNAEEARIVLNHPKCYNKAELYGDVQYVFRNSLLLVDVDKWKPRRRYLRSAFKTNMLNGFCPTFYHQSCALLEKIKNIQPKEDLFKFFNKYAFMNFFLTSAGLDGDDINPEIERFGDLVDVVQDEFVKLLANPLIPAFIWMRIPPGKKLRYCMREMKRSLRLILLDLKKERAQTSHYIENPSEMPLIDLLISDNYEKERESDVFEEFTLFSGAATDTTGHTLAFVFTLLGMFPEIQQTLYEEIVSVVGDRTIELANMQSLKYTEAVISETLRVLPTVPLFGRYCSEDVDIGTKVVPKGANVFISAYHIHRNPKYWKDPLRFDPTRFLPENIGKIPPGAYVPFSAGPRNCIGQLMAMYLIKITIANVIRYYEIKSNHKSIDEFVLESCISMKTQHPLDCKFVPRDKNLL